MADPYKCLRCTTISIGVYNVVYCIFQFGVLGWQVQAVKVIQWEYENRQLPATGSIDAYQARFPGLYAIYTETPERRRINAMYAIVLICLGLSIIHLMTTISMLFGAIKRLPNWILPWFFTCAPMVVMCTAYAVLWWSGDVFNEQLVMSVTEFVSSLAINGVCFIVVLMYYLRITGRLKSDKPLSPRHHPYDPQRRRKYEEDEQRRERAAHPPDVPNWRDPWPAQPSYSLERKLRRRGRDRSRSPVAALRQDYRHNPWSPITDASSLRRRDYQQRYDPAFSRLSQSYDRLPLGASAQSTQGRTPFASVSSTPLPTQVLPSREISARSSQRPHSSPQFVVMDTSSPTSRHRSRSRTPSTRRSGGVVAPTKKKESFSFVTSQKQLLRRKSPQRVSFKSKPKVYQRTPESSLSSQMSREQRRGIHGEIHTVV